MSGNDEITTLQITKEASKKLGDIADYFRRSKIQQMIWWIENEHARIFEDGKLPATDQIAALESL